jgi:cobalt/nickel transport system permease protein
MQGMFDNGFSNGNSIIHHLDPRFRLVIAAAFSVLIAVSSRWAALIMGLFFSIILVLIGRLPFKNVCGRLILVNGLILFLWLFVPFSFKGMPLFTIGTLTASREGIIYVTLLTLRSNTIVLVLISLLSTMPIFTLGRAMREIKVPDKLVLLFFFTYRYLHVIHLEYQRLLNALKIRGFQPKTSLHTYRTYAYLVGMLLVKSYDRSERIRKAMLCRGFRGIFHDMNEFSLKFHDFLMMSLMLLIVAGIALLQWTRIIF